jgi:hypothetical protein
MVARVGTVTAMARIDRATRLLAQALAVVGLGALLCFAVMTMADGLLRFFFARPIDAVRDVGGLVAAFVVARCIPAALKRADAAASVFAARLRHFRLSSRPIVHCADIESRLLVVAALRP